ncbi:hypothetical protein QR98_0083290 [Sarcoptes scabiei]|uniref:Uncharacterized protein n=1 Tax=Sarcoptes scabiei TaxID=52283 RepID=A0A132AFM5_SARSC|nr:hypothetical protein QR98_0083290 [Sarcoptes scabiei]
MNPSNGKKIDQKTQPSSISSVSGASGSTISNPSSEAMIAQRDYRYEAYKSPTLLDWSKSNLFRSQQTIETNQLESSSTTSQHNASTNTASSINKMISLESAEYRNDALFIRIEEKTISYSI